MKFNELRFEINSACNLRCVHCYTDKNRETLITPDQLSNYLERHKSIGKLSITGGEPLLNMNRLEEFALKAKEQGILVRVNTNGVLLNPINVKRLKDMGIHELQISLNGSEAKSFNDFVGAPVFESVIEGIKNSVEAGIFVTIRYSLTPQNAHELIDTYLLTSDIGVHLFKVRSAIETEGNIGMAELDKESYLVLKSNLLNYRTQKNIPVSIKYSQDKTGSETKCGCGIQSMFLSCDGKFYSCQFLRENPNMSIGTLDASGKISQAAELFQNPKNTAFLNREMACCTTLETETVNAVI